MQIKITQCSNPVYWYKDKIGQQFEVRLYDNVQYEVVGELAWIMKRDCEEVIFNPIVGVVKPPLGIIPQRLWKEERLHNLRDAIQIRLGRVEIPIEWVEEYNNLIKEQI